MKTNIAIMLVTAVLITPIAGHATDATSVTGSIKENVSDAVITTKIKAEYAKDRDVSAMKIRVDTDDKGIVTLSGNATSRAEADKAVKIARDTNGVSSVKDDIKVQIK